MSQQKNSMVLFLCIILWEESKCHKEKEHMDHKEVDHLKRRKKRLKKAKNMEKNGKL